ncbi:OTU domain-containing protein 5 [Phlyctochytrium bullatum]|nr:OTU domain-containing protein 5 [Phlyctochytrium bullatum]
MRAPPPGSGLVPKAVQNVTTAPQKNPSVENLSFRAQQQTPQQQQPTQPLPLQPPSQQQPLQFSAATQFAPVPFQLPPAIPPSRPLDFGATADIQLPKSEAAGFQDTLRALGASLDAAVSASFQSTQSTPPAPHLAASYVAPPQVAPVPDAMVSDDAVIDARSPLTPEAMVARLFMMEGVESSPSFRSSAAAPRHAFKGLAGSEDGGSTGADADRSATDAESLASSLPSLSFIAAVGANVLAANAAAARHPTVTVVPPPPQPDAMDVDAPASVAAPSTPRRSLAPSEDRLEAASSSAGSWHHAASLPSFGESLDSGAAARDAAEHETRLRRVQLWLDDHTGDEDGEDGAPGSGARSRRGSSPPPPPSPSAARLRSGSSESLKKRAAAEVNDVGDDTAAAAPMALDLPAALLAPRSPTAGGRRMSKDPPKPCLSRRRSSFAEDPLSAAAVVDAAAHHHNTHHVTFQETVESPKASTPSRKARRTADKAILERFERTLRVEHGMQILQVVEDASSLFRAFADDVFGDQEFHAEVRRRCVEHMRRFSSQYSGFVAGASYDKYLNNLLNLEVRASDLELQALVDCFGMPVELFQLGSTDPVLIQPAFDSTRTSSNNGSASPLLSGNQILSWMANAVNQVNPFQSLVSSGVNGPRKRDPAEGPVRLCVLGPNRYHRLVRVSRTEGEIVLDEVDRKAIMLSLQESQAAQPTHNAPTFAPIEHQKPPLVPTASSTSVASGSSSAFGGGRTGGHRVDRIMKIAGGVAGPEKRSSSNHLSVNSSSRASAGSGSGSSMDDDEFEALQAVLEMSLREAQQHNSLAPPNVTVSHGSLGSDQSPGASAPRLDKRSRRVSFAEEVRVEEIARDVPEEDAGFKRGGRGGGYDEDEALRLAIEASRVMYEEEAASRANAETLMTAVAGKDADMVVGSSDEDQQTAIPTQQDNGARRWKGKEKA